MWNDLRARDPGFGIQSLHEVAFSYSNPESRIPNPEAQYRS
jgi:hypothetical protein